MGTRFLTTIFLSQIFSVASFSLLDRYYERLTRDDPQASFYTLNQAQLIEDDTSDFADESPGTSLDFMVAPVQMTNPLFNFISKAGQLYRYLRSGQQ
ncbi:hypothetical protein OSTOST_16200 [Ostertagia ostertagi]